MKINKINEMIELDKQFDVELEGCLDDCTEYFCKGSFEVLKEQSQGLAGDGSDLRNQTNEFKTWVASAHYYCYTAGTAKTTIWW